MTAYHTAELIGDRIWLIRGLANDLMYLVAGTERALLIDTGMGFGDLAGFVKSLTSLPYYGGQYPRPSGPRRRKSWL